jgi:hypothetical protein
MEKKNPKLCDLLCFLSREMQHFMFFSLTAPDPVMQTGLARYCLLNHVCHRYRFMTAKMATSYSVPCRNRVHNNPLQQCDKRMSLV